MVAPDAASTQMTVTNKKMTTCPPATPTSSSTAPLLRHLSSLPKWDAYSDEYEVFIRAFPKVELHVHLDGSFDPDMLFEYLTEEPQRLADRHPECIPLPWENNRLLHIRQLVQEALQPLTDYNENSAARARYHALCTCRGHRSLVEMLNRFAVFLPLVQGDLPLVESLTYDFCRRQKEQHVVYTEVRYSPHLLALRDDDLQDDDKNPMKRQDPLFRSLQCCAPIWQSRGLSSVTPDEVVQAVTRGLRRGSADFGITVNQILCCVSWSPEWAWETMELVDRYRTNYPCATVGLDVAAGEDHFMPLKFPHTAQLHAEALAEARRRGIPLTLHAGEIPTGSADHVRQAIVEHGARRIGHGYRTVEDPHIVQLVKNRNVHLEVCPTSSFETGGWIIERNNKNNKKNSKKASTTTGVVTKDWTTHPCVTMKEKGISFSFSSDDPGVFHTSLAWQYRVALGKMGLSPHDIYWTNLQGIAASFATQDTKQRVAEQIHNFAQSVGLERIANSSATTPKSSKSKALNLSSSSLSDHAENATFVDRVYVETGKNTTDYF